MRIPMRLYIITQYLCVWMTCRHLFTGLCKFTSKINWHSWSDLHSTKILELNQRLQRLIYHHKNCFCCPPHMIQIHPTYPPLFPRWNFDFLRWLVPIHCYSNCIWKFSHLMYVMETCCGVIWILFGEIQNGKI